MRLRYPVSILFALAFRDDTLHFIQPAIGAWNLLDNVASDLSRTTRLASLGCPPFHALLGSGSICRQASSITLALRCGIRGA